MDIIKASNKCERINMRFYRELRITYLVICVMLLVGCVDCSNPTNNTTIYTLMTYANPEVGGTVSRNPNQINHTAGARIIVTATPANGYRFNGWSGGATSTTSPMTVTMNGDLALTANFIRACTLRIVISPEDGGTVTHSPVQATYDPGTRVTVQAIPAEGYRHTGWSWYVASTSNPRTITINANSSDQILTAIFRKIDD